MGDSTFTPANLTSVSEDNFELIPHNGVWGIICTIIIQLIIVGATCFLIFIICRMRERNTTNLLILNQTVADLFNGVIFVSLAVAHYVRPSHIIYSVIPYVNIYIVLLSLCTVFTLALHRYWKCRNPLSSHQISYSQAFCGKRWLLKAISVTWLIPLVISMLPLMWSKEPLQKQLEITRIFGRFVWVLLLSLFAALIIVKLLIFKIVRRQLKPKFTSSVLYSANDAVLSVVQRTLKTTSSFTRTSVEERGTNNTNNLPVIYQRQAKNECDFNDKCNSKSPEPVQSETYTPASHLLIMESKRKDRRTRKNGKRQKRDIRIERLLGALMVSLFVSYFPIVFINFVYLFQIHFQLPEWIQTVSFYTFIFNSAVNPLLCIFMKRDLFNKAKFYMKRLCVSIARSDFNDAHNL